MKTVNPSAARMLRELLDQHNRSEKHIGYHILPERVNAAVVNTEYQNHYKYWERERWDYITKHLSFRDKTVLDIGCNVGYFAMSSLDSGALRVTGYEGKTSCADFLTCAIRELGEEDRFIFHNCYYQFNDHNNDDHHYDIALLLNVLHHLGHDYGDNKLDKESAKQKMFEQLNHLSKFVNTLILQFGFNWKGDKNLPLFTGGTKREMIDYVTSATHEDWQILHIGVAQRQGHDVAYRPVGPENIARDDSLGEFLNRPLFILKSRHIDTPKHP